MKTSIRSFFCTFLLIAFCSISSLAMANDIEEGGCDATFSFTQVEGGYAVNFQAAVEMPGIYTWDFGNSNTSNDVNPQGVDFAGPGSYNVCLHISSGICEEPFCQIIEVLCIEGQTLQIAVVGEYNSSPQPEVLTLSLTGDDQYFEHELYFGPMSSSTVSVYACNASECMLLAITDEDNDLLGTAYHVTVTTSDEVILYDQPIDNPVLDANGQFLNVSIPEGCTLSNVGSLTNEQMTAYPNPFGEALRINGVHGTCTASLYDMCGSLVCCSLLNASSSSISTTALASGCYVLKLATAEGATCIRVVKE